MDRHHTAKLHFGEARTGAGIAGSVITWALLIALGCGEAQGGRDGGSSGDGGASAPDSAELPNPVPVPVLLPNCDPVSGAPPPRAASLQPPSLSWLTVSGRRVLDEEGREVWLRGTNFGAWLQAESWLSGYGRTPELGECTTEHATCYHDLLVEDWAGEAETLGLDPAFRAARRTNLVDWVTQTRARWPMVQEWRDAMWSSVSPDGREALSRFWSSIDASPWVFEEESLWAHLRDRFGAEAESLRTLHQRSFITELDVERVAELGLNTVRVPVWYGNLEEDTPVGPRPRAEGWARLDALMEWARRHAVYVIIDLHGAPGGQSHYDHAGLRNGGSLWTRPECVERAANLWRVVAARYADDPHVAMYDLLNEPAAPTATDFERVHRALYDAVRSVDARHVVAVEDGYRGLDGVRSPSEMGMQNVVWSIHDYPKWTSPTDYAEKLRASVATWREAGARFEVPIYLGEFSPEATGPDGSPEGLRTRVDAMDAALRMLNEQGVHWTPWTWKTGGRADSTWGLYHPADPAWIDVSVLDRATLESAFAATRSDDWSAIPSLHEVFRRQASFER